MPYDDAGAESFVYRYQKMIFALVLYLIGGDRDKAYEIATTSFAQVLGQASLDKGEGTVFIDVIKYAIENCRNAEALPIISSYDFIDLSCEDRKTLLTTARALQKVPFEVRVFILLRDQLHMSYDDISIILRTTEARAETNQARLFLREEIKKLLNHAG